MGRERELMIVIDVFEDGKRRCRMTSKKKVTGKQDAHAVLSDLVNRVDTKNYIEFICESREEIREDLKDVPPEELPF